MFKVLQQQLSPHQPPSNCTVSISKGTHINNQNLLSGMSPALFEIVGMRGKGREGSRHAKKRKEAWAGAGGKLPGRAGQSACKGKVKKKHKDGEGVRGSGRQNGRAKAAGNKTPKMPRWL